MKKLISTLMVVVFLGISSQAKIMYVNPNLTTNGDGTSWTNAYNNLSSAINTLSATSLDTIYVATSTISLSSTITIHSKDVVLKGGFNPTTNMQDSYTTVDGGNATAGFLLINLEPSTVIDHFIIQNGKNISGGGMNINRSSPTISNIIFQNNQAINNGGAIYNFESSPILSNIVFKNNRGNSSGGAIYNVTSDINMENVVFQENFSNYGGAIYNYESRPIITNAIFYGNSSNYWGGAVANFTGSGPTFINVTFCNNTTNTKGGVFDNRDSSTVTLYNSAFYGNSASTSNPMIIGNDINSLSNYIASDIMEGGIGSGSNFVNLSSYTASQIFADTSDVAGTDGNFRTSDDGLIPTNGSPLINAGSNSYNILSYDLTGNSRIIGGNIDIGAYENPSGVFINRYQNQMDVTAFSASDGTIRIVNNSDYSGEIKVYNAAGQIVLIAPLKANMNEELGKTFNPGVYLVEAGNIQSRKVVKLIVR